MSEPKTAEVKVRKMLWCNNPWCGGGRYCKLCKDACTAAPASPPAETGEGFTSLDGLWKNPALSRLDRVKAHRSEFGSDLKTALEAVDEESGRQSIAAAAQPVSPSEWETTARDHMAWMRNFVPCVYDVTEERLNEIDAFLAHPASDQSDTERMRAALRNIADCRETVAFGHNALDFCIDQARSVLEAGK